MAESQDLEIKFPMNKITKLNLIKALMILRYAMENHDAKWVKQLQEKDVINYETLDTIVNEIKDKKDNEVAYFYLDEILLIYIAHDVSLKMMFSEGSDIAEKIYTNLGLSEMIPVNDEGEEKQVEIRNYLRMADQRLLKQIEKICKNTPEFHDIKEMITNLDFD